MKPYALVAALVLTAATPALAQHEHTAHGAPSADPHAGHHMSVAPAAAPADDQTAPAVPADHDADRYYPAAEMAQARAQLRVEHGDIPWSKVTIEKLEVRPGPGVAGYGWEGRASFGGDVDRLLLKSRGDGGRRLERGELDVLWSHAVSPWFDLQTGLRQDFQRGGRTYATVGVEGLTPYEFDVSVAAFVSDRGDLGARLEAAHDFRITQRLILEPRAEANFASRDQAKAQVGAGLSDIEAGLRLRYHLAQELAPYIGVNYERRFGHAAAFRRAVGEDAEDTRLVVGLRAWF